MSVSQRRRTCVHTQAVDFTAKTSFIIAMYDYQHACAMRCEAQHTKSSHYSRTAVRSPLDSDSAAKGSKEMKLKLRGRREIAQNARN